MKRQGSEFSGDKPVARGSMRKKRSESPSSNSKNPKKRGHKKPTSLQGRTFEKNDRLKRVNEDVEPIPLFEPVEVSLDTDPENQEQRINQTYKEVQVIEEDLAPLSQEQKREARRILEE